MSNLIGLLLVIFAPISVFSVSDVDKLQIKRDSVSYDKGLTVEDTEEKLQSIKNEYGGQVEIAGVRVDEILSYKDSSCSPETLVDPRLKPVPGGCNWSYGFNGDGTENVGRLLESYIPKRIKSCVENFFPIFENAVKDIEESIDGEFFKELTSIRWDPRWLKVWVKVADRKKDDRFLDCVTLVKKLSRAKLFDEEQSIHLEPYQRQVTQKWYNFLDSCKFYTEKLCIHYYKDILKSGQYLELERENKKFLLFSDFYYECPTIVEIGLTDKTRKKLEAMKKSRNQTP